MHIRLPPQRFRYLLCDCGRDWKYGAIFEAGTLRYAWSEDGTYVIDGDIDSDPTQTIKAEIGDVQSFEWLDHDGGWPDE